MLSSSKDRYSVMACTGVCFIGFFLILSSALAITELVFYSIYHNDNQDCDNTQVISPLTWLLVDGIIQIVVNFLIFLIFSILLCTMVPEVAICAVCIKLPYGLFNFAWLIAGSISFWRDNLHCSPQPLNNMLWATLIIKCVIALGSVCTSSNSSKTTTTTSPGRVVYRV